MPAVTTSEQFLNVLQRSKLVQPDQLEVFLEPFQPGENGQGNRPGGPQVGLPEDPRQLARELIQGGLITKFQAQQLLQGKSRGFFVQGKYKLMSLLGAGGTARVYLCHHQGLDRKVALKFLPLQTAGEELLKRFYREAKAVASLNHPNIVHVFDIDRVGELHFMVLEYVDGPNLHDLVSKAGPLPPVQAADYIRQTAEGLNHAYQAGWLHRDIKPGNLLLAKDETIKILDLGLARFFNGEPGELTLTHEVGGTVLGTVDYMSPEQALRSADVDIRSDLYSLGATLYYLLAGRPPLAETDVSAATKLLWLQLREPTPLHQLRPEVPMQLSAVVNKMLAKDPNRRFQTPAEVSEVLRRWAVGELTPQDLQPPSGLTQTVTVSGQESQRLASQAPGSQPVTQTGSPQTASPDSDLSWENLTRPGGYPSGANPEDPSLDGWTPRAGFSQIPGLEEIDEESVIDCETAVLRWQGAAMADTQAGQSSWKGWASLRSGDVTSFKQALARLPLWLLLTISGGGWVLAAVLGLALAAHLQNGSARLQPSAVSEDSSAANPADQLPPEAAWQSISGASGQPKSANAE